MIPLLVFTASVYKCVCVSEYIIVTVTLRIFWFTQQVEYEFLMQKNVIYSIWLDLDEYIQPYNCNATDNLSCYCK